jgi:hypothetical protein
MIEHTITIPNLTLAEFYDLQDSLGESVKTAPDNANTGEKHGTLELIAAVVIITTASLQALATWLSKNRKTVEITRTEHSTSDKNAAKEITYSIRIESETSDANVLKQIQDFTRFLPGRNK